ncbi:unnamed protein product [Peronospora belbahrii]|uniref:Myb-like domain-containing protein n=1 Tax=Peronospora belbahrii TaxID=622444 RepID=A0AAU9L1U8_9STRA|nr:unnamed protein product [Peronospora belbahrii]
MASASRVPLLVKSKGRISSRASIAPRSRPPNGPRTKRTAMVDGEKDKDEEAEQLKNREAPKTSEEVLDIADTTLDVSTKFTAKLATLAVKNLSSKATNGPRSTTVIKPLLASSVVDDDTNTAGDSISGASGVQVRQTGGILAGDSLSTTPSSAKSPGTRPEFTDCSPVVLPVHHQRSERLVKITSAGPLYRASPAMRPRAGSIGSSLAVRSRGVSVSSSPGVGPQNPMQQRLLRKLDIKPHQSPRRSAMQLQQQNVNNHDGTASPLMLGGEPSGVVPDMQLDAKQSRSVNNTTKTTRVLAVTAKKNRPVTAKRRKCSETMSVQTNANASTPERRSLRRKAKHSTFRETDESGSLDSEPDDDWHEDVNSHDLGLPKDEINMYVPARERATMWAKSLLQKDCEGKKGDKNKGGGTSQAIVTREKKTAARRKLSNLNASLVTSAVTGIGGSMTSRSKMEELLKKEPSQMTMGELALTVPRGRRIKRHEHEEAALDAPLLAGSSGEGSSNLLNMNALNRVRSLSVSSESAAFAGSLVTPHVQIIDGQMVVLENTIKLGDELQRTVDELGEGSIGGDNTGLPPRHTGSRYSSSHPNGPGKRWGKEETKQFYYCLSQVGPNFSMMATLFPTRKRKELKSKFKYEEKNHGKLIEIALRASAAPLDSEIVDVISQMVDKETQRKLNAQKKHKTRSQQELLCGDEDTASVVSSMVSSPMSTPQVHTEEFVETLNDDDLFPSSRHGSFDFSS